MVSILEAIILGIVQGITEWLPVSSSGHLVIFQELLNIKADLFFDVLLHFGSLIVVLLVFWGDIKKIILSLIHYNKDVYKEDRKFAFFILISGIFTGIIALLFKDFFESLFTNVKAIGIALLVTGVILLLNKIKVKEKDITLLDGILIGISQGIAIIPGISRSGITITTGVLRGLNMETVIKYSFLLFIPSVIGAMLFEFNGFDFEISYLIGMLIAMIVSYFSIKLLIKFVMQKKLYWFSVYCFIIGLLLLIL